MDILEFAEQDKLVIIEFTSSICTKCENIKPFLKKLQEAYEGKLSIKEINAIDDFPTAEHYSIRDLPTFIFIKDGTAQFRLNSFKSENHFEKAVRTHL